MRERGQQDAEMLEEMDREMQRIADEVLRGYAGGLPSRGRYWQPRVDLHETGDSLVIKMELAGVRPEGLTVSLSSDGRTLSVSGERHETDGERSGRTRCYQLEIYFGPFERSVALPADVRVDRQLITATYSAGMLLVTLPKCAKHTVEVRTVAANAQD